MHLANIFFLSTDLDFQDICVGYLFVLITLTFVLLLSEMKKRQPFFDSDTPIDLLDFLTNFILELYTSQKAKMLS